jgi:hypothetical protein
MSSGANENIVHLTIFLSSHILHSPEAVQHSYMSYPHTLSPTAALISHFIIIVKIIIIIQN